MKRHALIALSAGVGLLTGCVTTGTHKKLKADYDKSQADLVSAQERVAALEKEKDELRKAGEATQAQYRGVIDQLQGQVQQGQVTIRQFKNMLSVGVAEKIFFDPGSAKVKDTGVQVLKEVAGVLAPITDKVVRVVGHTDNVPITRNRTQFPTNWELSVTRAVNVARILQDAGLPPERLIAAGRGEYEPVAPNDTPEGRQMNRRIEIQLMDKELIQTMQEESRTPVEGAAP